MENKHVLIIIIILILATVASVFAIASMTTEPVVKPPINATGVNDTEENVTSTVVVKDTSDNDDDNDDDSEDEDYAVDGTSFDDEETTFPEEWEPYDPSYDDSNDYDDVEDY